MSTSENPYASFGLATAAQAPAAERATFLRKTYMHLAVAIYAFVALEYAIFNLVQVDVVMARFFAMRFAPLLLLGGFIVAAWVAQSWANSGASSAMQYAGLFLYVAAESVIFVPILWYAQQLGGGVSIIGTAGVVTLLLFGGLTAAVFLTGADFSFLRTGLWIGSLVAFGLILYAALFGMQLGVLFTVAMIVLAAGFILYDTSNVLHHYRTDQHVAAALALFASVALLFWYVLQLVMAFSSRD